MDLSEIFAAIPKVTSGLALIAFVVAAVLSAYYYYYRSRQKILEQTPAAQLPEVVQALTKHFGIDTNRLTNEQRFDLAMVQVRGRQQRFLVSAVVVVILAVILASITVYDTVRSVSFEGALSVLVGALQSEPGADNIQIDPELDSFWTGLIVAYSESELINEPCVSRTCLSCVDEGSIVRISLGGELESFVDGNGVTWKRCKE